MNEAERLARTYASYSDKQLRAQIRCEQSFKDGGYHPEELDLKKRGFNPDTCDSIIAEIQAELNRRGELPIPPPRQSLWRRIWETVRA